MVDTEEKVTDEQLLSLRTELTALRLEAPYFCEQIDACTWQVARRFILESCGNPQCEWCLLTIEKWNEMQNAEFGTRNAEHLKRGERAKYDPLMYESFLMVSKFIGERHKFARPVIDAMLYEVIKAHVHADCGKGTCWICTSQSYAEMRNLTAQIPRGMG